MSKLFEKQAVSKQLSEILSSFEKCRNESGNKQHVSIDGLLEKCVDSEPILSDASCNAIVFLVSSEDLNINFIMQKFIALLQTARNIRSLLLAIRNLLHLQLEKCNTGFPYCILQSGDKNNCVHPLIQVLQTRPDAWNNVFETVKYLLNETSRPQQKILELLEPLLHFVMWNPSRMEEWHHLCPYTTRLLIQRCSQVPNVQLIDFLFKSMFWVKLKSPAQLIENGILLQDIAELFMKLPIESSKLDKVLLCVTATCVETLNRNLDISSCLRTMLNLAAILKDVNMTIAGHSTVVLLGSLMQSAPVSYQKQVILLCTLLFGRNGVDPVVAVTLLPPLLGVMFAPSNFITKTNKFSCEAVALRKSLEEMLRCKCGNGAADENVTFDFYDANFSPSAKFALQISTLLKCAVGSTAFVHEWLERMKTYLSHTAPSEISYPVFNLVCGILLHGLQDLQIVHLCVEVALLIVKVDSSKVPDLIPVLLYKMNSEANPELRLHILQTFPRLAVNKIHVGSVLNILQAVANQKGLAAIGVRLMYCLWKQQERIFPQLQKLLVLSEDDHAVRKEYGVNEVLVSKAATICQVCQENPQLYGVDFLPTLSKMVSVHGGNAGESVCALALEGIITLCKAEVIDLQTTWKVLSSKLKSDKRILILKKTCELLSLVKTLPLLSSQYEKFVNEGLTILWKFTTHQNAEVVAAAFAALGSFKPNEHRLQFFPEVVRNNVKVPSHLIATPFDRAKKAEELLSYVPGSCYVHLMTVVPSDALLGYASFLSSLVRQEVDDLPRGISFAAQLRSSRSSSTTMETSQLQPVLVNYFRRNKNPSLQGGISVAALLVYEPDVKDADKDVGCVNSGRDYKQVLDRLLVEVPFDASDWRRTVVLGPAWQLFMSRAYVALVESRASELKLQYNRGMLDCSAEEYSFMQNSVWLYVRDKLTEMLRSTFRGKPSVQGNSVLALASLVTAAAEYESQCGQSVAEGGKHLSHAHWTKIVVESLLCLVDDTRDPRGQTFAWCHTASHDANALGSLPKACAALALSQLSSVLVATEVDYVQQIIDSLKVKLLTSLDNPLMHFSLGISIGLLIQGLMKFRFTDLAAEEGTSLITEAVNFLNDWCLNGKDSNIKSGPLIGLSLAVSSLVSDCEFGKIVLANQKSILRAMTEEKPSSHVYEILHVCNAIVTLSACNNNLVAAAAIDDLFVAVREKCHRSKNNIDLATALGLICGAQKIKSASIDTDGIFKTWMATLVDETCPTLAHLSAIYGLFAMNNLCSVLNLSSTDQYANVNLHAQQTAKQMTAMILKSSDVTVLNCSWMLGCYFQKTMDNVKSPTSYYYLGDKSVLRYVADFVTRFNESEDGWRSLATCLTSLAQDFPRPLPPLEWSLVFAPLLTSNVTSEIENLVVNIALNQSQTSPSALVLVNKWLYVPAFAQLHKSSQTIILDNLPKLMSTISPKKLQVFLDKLITYLFSRKTGPDDVLSNRFLHGLASSLKMNEPPLGITSMLYAIVGKLYAFIAALQKPLLILFCDVLMELPNDEVLGLVNLEGRETKGAIASLHVTCRLTACGKLPASRLQSHIETVSAFHSNEHDSTLDILHQSFQTFADPHVTEADKISFTIELMGLIKKCVQWKSRAQVGADHLIAQVSYLIKVFATCVVCWSSADLAITWHPCFLPYGDQILNLLPAALPALLRRSVWSQNTKKVVDWMVTLLQDRNVDGDIRMVLKGALLQMRNAEEFKKLSVWTTLL